MPIGADAAGVGVSGGVTLVVRVQVEATSEVEGLECPSHPEAEARLAFGGDRRKACVTLGGDAAAGLGGDMHRLDLAMTRPDGFQRANADHHLVQG